MKKILCFGDSNTFGFIPGSGKRYDEKTRWTGILKQNLHPDFNVIEAGCNNRTGFVLNPENEELTGFLALPKYMSNDIDVLILALGINDTQLFYSTDEEIITQGIEKLIGIAKNFNPNIKIMLVSPSCLDENVLNGFFSFQFNKNSIEKSKKLADIYKQAAEKYKLEYLNLDEYVKVSKKDDLHYEEKEHAVIAQILTERILREY